MDQQPAAATEAVRSFNRFYTRRIGVLEENLLGSGLTLSQARAMFELGRRGEWTAGGMASELGLDAGYVSRLLASLEKRSLIARRPSEADARRALVALTRKGRNCYALLDRRSQSDIARMLGRLGPAQLRRLLSAMAAIETLLGEGGPLRVPYIIRPHRAGDIGWVISRHGALYTEEFGWDETFEGFVAEIAGAFIKTIAIRVDIGELAVTEAQYMQQA